MNARRYSRQRELIYEYLCGTTEHPTAEMIYASLKPQSPHLGLGTVYRNLSLLCEDGRVRRLPFPVERYDGNLSEHAHFCCQQCGKVSDLFLSETAVSETEEAVARHYGHQVHHHELIYYGVCAQCLSAQADTSEGQVKQHENQLSAQGRLLPPDEH
ncbi:MAG: transcriptional repressor, partial [Clostridiales bacterium]|nr:transcriptional repressor [Clostridiales bacterium]MCD7857880.1 transcriptional repressor [Clostridiales bacterium]